MSVSAQRFKDAVQDYQRAHTAYLLACKLHARGKIDHMQLYRRRRRELRALHTLRALS